MAISRTDNYTPISDNAAMSSIGSLVGAIIYFLYFLKQHGGLAHRFGRFELSPNIGRAFVSVHQFFVGLRTSTSPQDISRNHTHANVV